MTFAVYTKEFSYNIKLALPVILGMLGHTTIGIVDNYMVGGLGSTELAAVSLGNSFIFIAMSLGIGFSTAITPMIAKADAEHNHPKVRTTFHHGLFLCTILGVLLFVITVWSKQIIMLMNQPKAVVALAIPYINWAALSLIPMIIFQAYKQFADGLSFTKYAMYAVLATNFINALLNYLLIYGVWFFPKYGVQGAGMATTFSRVFMLIIIHYLLIRNKKIAPYFQKFTFREIKKRVLNKIIRVGFPSSLQMLFEVVLFVVGVWLAGTLGKNSQAANQIALTIASSTYMVAFGFSVSAMIRVGQAKGRGDNLNLLVVARSIFLLTIIIEVIFAFFIIALHKLLPLLFLNMEDANQLTDNMEIIGITANLLLIAALFQISDGIQVVVLGALRGLQDVKIPMYITFVAYWLIGFPISYYLGRYTELKTSGIWIGFLVGLSAAAFFLFIRFHALTKMQNNTSD